jgi:HKD family nuclease
MRSTLHLKFLVAYIIFGFLSIFSAVILSSNLTENILVSSMASGMNQEASLFANDSLPD